MGDMSSLWHVQQGDALECLRGMADGSVQCCLTSPPYWGLRDYEVDGQIGLEETLASYVAKLVEVFTEVRRVLRDDGTLWLVLGDTYSGGRNGAPGRTSDSRHRARTRGWVPPQAKGGSGLANKQLCGVPWRVALALQDAGWWLRSEIIWHKVNAPVEGSVRDRPSRSHESVFLFARGPKYKYRLPAVGGGTVWAVATEPFVDGHCASFPEGLVGRAVASSTDPTDVVLDPFAGSGTTLKVAVERGREAVGIELNPEYVELSKRRLAGVTAPLFAECAA